MCRLTSNAFCIILFCGSICNISNAQTNDNGWWHNKQRKIHYQPQGSDFVRVNGGLRFNRALYGTNTGFRIETGDLPEFAFYMPGMGGNFKLGLIAGNNSKWLIDAQNIKTIYRPGSMVYEIKDPLLGNGLLKLTILALANREGMIIQYTLTGVEQKTELIWVYGGASGKRFSRDGDIGADPESSFYLHPEYCTDNTFQIKENKFQLHYGTGKVLSEMELYEIQHIPSQGIKTGGTAQNLKSMAGVFAAGTLAHLADAAKQQLPSVLYQSSASSTPVITGKISLTNQTGYYLLQNSPLDSLPGYNELPVIFNHAESARKKIVDRVTLVTPDLYLNTLGGALGIAADAIWETPSYMHGAIAWRMRLPAWRGAYTADPLGWHDRARTHFSSYAKSQVTTPESGPVTPDTALHFARQLEKMGTAMFSSGYICRNPNGDIRPHHYDMNLVFIDQLMTHFNWTGDIAFAKQIWPVIQKHFDWEKRNFDADGDGLYDAYCCIWASDALQYSGGGVTHSSAYNYRANKLAAELAVKIGEDGSIYKKEADKILQAIQTKLWIPEKGWYAEYKDLLGLKSIHPSAALWTIYHTIDSEVPDIFQAYQSLRYIDNEIPHIPVRAIGFPDSGFVLSTTSWHPYTWSINNVALAENLHAALAYWQGGRADAAFHLWKTSILESMYLSSSPGGFQQLPFYDAVRGELYRDFADPIGMAARSLVEGVFGILPDALNNKLVIRPGYPLDWDHATLKIADIDFNFKRTGNDDRYTIISSFVKPLQLHLQVRAARDEIRSVKLNGKNISWKMTDTVMSVPRIEIEAGLLNKYIIDIEWAGDPLTTVTTKPDYSPGNMLVADTKKASLLQIYDPQQMLTQVSTTNKSLEARINLSEGNKTIFVKLKQGSFSWWQPVCFKVKPAAEIVMTGSTEKNSLRFRVLNHSMTGDATITVNRGSNAFVQQISLNKENTIDISVQQKLLRAGTNLIEIEAGRNKIKGYLQQWNIDRQEKNIYEKINLTPFFNDRVTNIFSNNYLSPRPQSPTLQLPTHGIGNWCYPLATAIIDDNGLRQRAGTNNEIVLEQGIPFSTPGPGPNQNVSFTSLWDNYPDSISIPLSGKAMHIYLLMAGSTNPMQSRFVNGELIVKYKDGTTAILSLINPETWWPIEQDYVEDGYAFTFNQPKPPRLHLKTGLVHTDFKNYTSIKGFSNRAIDGGAATILDLPLDETKELETLTVRTMANDVLIGLMSATLLRSK
ncbi:MAG: DUF4450 domain-containing protein [Chitinophagaceae bacterium]|nr:DUF4450 domain-containing protein [Chitinophagaceae bacterium]